MLPGNRFGLRFVALVCVLVEGVTLAPGGSGWCLDVLLCFNPLLHLGLALVLECLKDVAIFKSAGHALSDVCVNVSCKLVARLNMFSFVDEHGQVDEVFCTHT